MDELFGDNVIICNVPTDEILESLPIEESQIVSLMMNTLRQKDTKEELQTYCKYAMESYKDDIKYYTCFSMALNLLSWEGYEQHDKTKIDIFADLYYIFYENLEKYFKDDKDFQYWYKIMD